MKKNIRLIIILFLLISCVSTRVKNKDFVIENYHNAGYGEYLTTSYNSYTSQLIKYNEKVKITLNEKEKYEIYKYFKKLNPKSISSCFKSEDSINVKINFVFKNSKISKNKCSVDNDEIQKHLLLYSKVLQYLKSKEEYKKAFPAEFEVY